MAVKQNDIRLHLKDKIDPAAITMLCALAEEQRVIQQTLKEMAEAINTITDIVMSMTTVAENMKNTIQMFTNKDFDANINIESLKETEQ
jgi:prophage DNA circulation protein